MEVVPLIPGHDDLVACFSTRTGGVSPAPFDSLNLGFASGDDPEHVVANRERLAAYLDVPLERWLVVGQAHGARVLTAHDAVVGVGTRAPAPNSLTADGVLLPEPGLFALSLSADCPLVVLADPGLRRVGVTHAGWRGTAAGAVVALVRALVRAGSAPGQLVAGVSPGICGGCYPVGDEVFAALEGSPGLDGARVGSHLDLRTLHRASLARAGVPEAAIHVHPDCSACTPSRYFSHRRDRGRTGRGGALVGWRS